MAGKLDLMSRFLGSLGTYATSVCEGVAETNPQEPDTPLSQEAVGTPSFPHDLQVIGHGPGQATTSPTPVSALVRPVLVDNPMTRFLFAILQQKVKDVRIQDGLSSIWSMKTQTSLTSGIKMASCKIAWCFRIFFISICSYTFLNISFLLL